MSAYYWQDRERFDALGETINGLEFDSVYVITADGIVQPSGVYAPEVQHDPENDISIDSPGWEAIRNMTGQDRYNGSVMHRSEFIGGSMAAALSEIADTAREDGKVTQFATVLVYDDEPNESGEFEPVGWTVVYRHVCSHDQARHQSTCGACGRKWCEVCTPTPSARCPFEYEHDSSE